MSNAEVDRLGKRGSYRLGSLGQQGLGRPAAQRPFQPSFRRPRHAGPVPAWVAAAIAGTGLIAWGAALGIWFMPVLVGLITGVVLRWGRWRLRVSIPAVVVMAAAGWGLAFWMGVSSGLPFAVARTIATQAGLPGLVAIRVFIALAFAALQALAGLLIGRAIARRPARNELGHRGFRARRSRGGQAGGERPAAREESADDLQERGVLAEDDRGET